MHAKLEAIKRLHNHCPILGLRTIKSVVAVCITALFMQYVLHQNPFFACIGAVVAVERTLSSSVQAVLIRNIATITGGVIGIAIASFTENIFLLSLGLIPLIFINNLLGRKESIVPGAIVYFAVSYLNTTDHAWIYGLTRIGGTLLGSLIGIAVNMLLFPPRPAQSTDQPEPEPVEHTTR
ncbi:aromatic acid exporter family protein [Ruminococcaceae bacterium OttesenSCG-928-L11]|nr:aromatic acid exporter family protein [Ruminococcaceae bacterium OttesenSCG-928-L11]